MWVCPVRALDCENVPTLCFGICFFLWTSGAYQDNEQAWDFTVLGPRQCRAFVALSFVNGAQLQQLAMMHVVCDLNPCYTSSKAPLAIAQVDQISYLWKIRDSGILWIPLTGRIQALFSCWFLVCFWYLLVLISCFEMITCIFKINILSSILNCVEWKSYSSLCHGQYDCFRELGPYEKVNSLKNGNRTSHICITRA